MALVTYRRGTLADSHTAFTIFGRSILDLKRRLDVTTDTGGDDPAMLERQWNRRRSLFEHLALTGDQFWLAESDGDAVGYARSIVRDGVQELTEFFVLPGQQSAGVGRELFARAFPRSDVRHRAIIATTDMRAQARYLKAGVYARFPIQYFSRVPETVAIDSDLTAQPITASPEVIEVLGAIDVGVVGHRRDVDHAWHLKDRKGYLYKRGDLPVGYGYLGHSTGPFAVLDSADFPAVLAHAESEAASRGDAFGVEVPQINRVAVDYLLSRGCRIDPFIALFMCDAPFGSFENYILPSPPFFL